MLIYFISIFNWNIISVFWLAKFWLIFCFLCLESEILLADEIRKWFRNVDQIIKSHAAQKRIYFKRYDFIFYLHLKQLVDLFIVAKERDLKLSYIFTRIGHILNAFQNSNQTMKTLLDKMNKLDIYTQKQIDLVKKNWQIWWLKRYIKFFKNLPYDFPHCQS